MTKKHFIALADVIRRHNQIKNNTLFTSDQLETLADFCKQQNWNFMRDRWMSYIGGECGPNGGEIKPTTKPTSERSQLVAAGRDGRQ